MCRLYALLANEPTKVECSLVYAQNALMQQSRSDSTGRKHADGWGVVCYDEFERSRIPTTVKHSNAAFDSDHFSRSAEKVYSKAVVAHVRLATVGSPSTLNAHPFTFDDWTFAHNGTIPSFDALSGELESAMEERFLNCRLGTTDSELLFLWLLNRMASHGIDSDNLTEKQGEARELLGSSIAELADHCLEKSPDKEPRLNFVLTNGHVLFACRWNNSLYSIVRDGVYDCEICGIPHIHHDTSIQHRAVVIASEPITSEAWNEVPNHSLTYVSPELTFETTPIPHNNLQRK